MDLTSSPSLTFHAPSGRTPWTLSPSADKTMWSLGRSPSCDICLDQGWVSGRKPHAYVRFNPSDRTWEIQDNDSTNGVWLNGVRSESMKWCPIIDNDELKFGNPAVPAWSTLYFYLAYDDDTLNTMPDEPTVGHIGQIASGGDQKQDNAPDSAIALLAWVFIALWSGPIDSPSPTFLLIWRVILIVTAIVALYEFGPLIISGVLD